MPTAEVRIPNIGVRIRPNQVSRQRQYILNPLPRYPIQNSAARGGFHCQMASVLLNEELKIMTYTYHLVRIVLPTLALASLAFAMTGCSNASGPERAAIRGKITVGGQPLAAGRILFTPIAPNEGPASSARILNGEYEVKRQEGPVVGANLVQIEQDIATDFAIDDEAAYAQRAATRTLPRSVIPPAYNRQSQVSVEVKSSTENSFDLNIVPLQQYSQQSYR